MLAAFLRQVEVHRTTLIFEGASAQPLEASTRRATMFTNVLPAELLKQEQIVRHVPFKRYVPSIVLCFVLSFVPFVPS